MGRNLKNKLGFSLLETWEFDSLEDMNRTLHFGNWNQIVYNFQRKYPGRELSFQTVSIAFIKKYKSNVYEIRRRKRDEI